MYIYVYIYIYIPISLYYIGVCIYIYIYISIYVSVGSTVIMVSYSPNRFQRPICQYALSSCILPPAGIRSNSLCLIQQSILSNKW